MKTGKEYARKRKRNTALFAVGLTGLIALSALGSPAADTGGTKHAEESSSHTAASDRAETGPAADGVVALPDAPVYRIGFVNIDNSELICYQAATNFRDYVQSETFASAIGTDSVTVLIADSANDIEQQMTNVETMLTNGVDMIFLIGVDTEGNTAAVEACNREGVPVFLVGTEATGGIWKYVGFDETEYGRIQGNWCAEHLEEDANLCLLVGTPGREAAIQRKDGFLEALSAREDLFLLSCQTGNFNMETSMQVTEDWITSYGDEIDCIVAPDNKSAAGAAEAVVQNQLNDSISVVGAVTFAEDLTYLENGIWDAAVLVDWPSIGFLCGEVCRQVYLGESVPARSNIALYSITEENMDELIREKTDWLN